MTKGASVYDKLDIAEEHVRNGDPDASELYETKLEVSTIDDELQELEEQLDVIRDKFIDNELTMNEVNEFFDKTIQRMVEDMKVIRERLY